MDIIDGSLNSLLRSYGTTITNTEKKFVLTQDGSTPSFKKPSPYKSEIYSIVDSSERIYKAVGKPGRMVLNAWCDNEKATETTTIQLKTYQIEVGTTGDLIKRLGI